MPYSSGDAEHPTLAADRSAARASLVVDERNQRPNIDLGPVTQPLSPVSSLQNIAEDEVHESSTNGKNKYFTTNDEAEQRRLDLQHQIYLTTFDGKLHLAPIKHNVKRALDIATGTGIWGIGFAQQRPNCKVIGFDLNKYVPSYVPSNYKFHVHDPEDPWPFRTHFDYIHGRTLASRLNTPSLVIKHAFDALSPGSYLELQDYIMPMRSIDSTYTDSFIETWQTLIIQGAAKLGRDLTQVKDYKKHMLEAGFVDVVEIHCQWPLGPWATNRKLKAIGVLFREDMERLIDGLSMRLLGEGLGMGTARIKKLVGEVRREWYEEEVHTYLPIIVVYGRKPE